MNALTDTCTASPAILLFGMPRSGTTWVGKIFDSHPDTLYRHEPDSWGLLNALPLMAPLENVDAYASHVQTFYARLADMSQTKVAASTPIFPKRYYSPLRYQLFRLNVVAAKAAARALGREQSVRHLIRGSDMPQIRLVWKSIESLGRIGVVKRSVRTCYGVHIARHPCGYVASVLRGDAQRRFTGGMPSSEDLELLAMCLDTPAAREHGLTLERLRALHPVERLAWRWVLYNAKAMQDIEGDPDAMTLRYEDLCRDPDGVARQLFAFTGLPWSEQTARFVSQSTAKDVGRYYSVVKNPLKAAYKWKSELSQADLDRIYSITSGTLPGALYKRD
jgi:hypothetical protein